MKGSCRRDLRHERGARDDILAVRRKGKEETKLRSSRRGGPAVFYLARERERGGEGECPKKSIAGKEGKKRFIVNFEENGRGVQAEEESARFLKREGANVACAAGKKRKGIGSYGVDQREGNRRFGLSDYEW